jgi:superfamily I DNA and/or RNA helicase
MHIWEQIKDLGLPLHIKQYKKWLDINSSHFFSIEIEEDVLSFYEQKSIARRAIETFRESGNYLVYLSSVYYLKDTEQDIPIFLTPVVPVVDYKNKRIFWSSVEPFFSLNTGIESESKCELVIDEIQSWLENQTIISQDSISYNPAAFYFNLNTKQYVNNDLNAILKSKQESQAFQDLMTDRLKPTKRSSNSDFLDLLHILPMDYSQAQAVSAAMEQSIIIAGPPGTGKSQTIINLAINEINQGKKVAIVSQKYAAIQVILHRLNQLDLNDFILNFNGKLDAISQIENTTKLVLEGGTKLPVLDFNLTYFQHSIRTLEEYYHASKSVSSSEKKLNYIDWNKNPFSTWIQPSPYFLGISIQTISEKLNELQALILNLDIRFDHESFQLLADLEPIIDMLRLVDLDILNRYLTDKEGKKSIKAIDKEILKLKARRPIESIFSRLSIDKLEYRLTTLKESKTLFSLFDSKSKIVDKEIETIDASWKIKNSWQKIEAIQEAIEFKNWELEFTNLNRERQQLIIDSAAENSIELLGYIDAKIKAKIPIWLFAFKWLIKKNEFYKSKTVWIKLIETYKWIHEKNLGFNEILISNFIENYIQNTGEIPISTIDWESICSISSTSQMTTKSIVDFPILKNYNFREIAQMAKFIRKNYHLYCSYKTAEFKEQFYLVKKIEFDSVLTSRKKEIKTAKDSLKKNLVYIQKNWSSKKKCPTIHQYLSAIDFDFLLVLKPLFIGTMEQFSQYTPLRLELYDTVIIDESSQVEVLDSIPALFRTKKIVIVGDDKQLTPTRFFRNQTFNFSQESILELAYEKFQDYVLNYHFRSKSKNLIQFSNDNFYKNKLKTIRRNDNDAVEWIYSPDGIYYQRKNESELL